MSERGIVAAIVAVATLGVELLRRMDRRAKDNQEKADELDQAWKRGDLPRILPRRKRRLRFPWS